MAGRYTDEERLKRGQYKVNGQWYTKSGYPIRNASDSSGETRSGTYTAYEEAAEQEAESTRQTAQTSAAGQAALRLLRQQKQAAAEETEQAARQAYLSKMLGLLHLEQALAASGASGGMTDTAYLRLLTQYEANRAKILAEGQRTAAEYDAKIAAAEEEQTAAAAPVSDAKTGITAKSTAAKSTAKTTAKTTSSKSTAKSSANPTAKSTSASGKASGTTLGDLLNAYRQTETQKVQSRLLSGQLTQGQARVLKNLLKKG